MHKTPRCVDVYTPGPSRTLFITQINLSAIQGNKICLHKVVLQLGLMGQMTLLLITATGEAASVLLWFSPKWAAVVTTRSAASDVSLCVSIYFTIFQSTLEINGNKYFILFNLHFKKCNFSVFFHVKLKVRERQITISSSP